jgi:hypothetical protein
MEKILSYEDFGIISENKDLNGLLHLSTEIKGKFGENGMFAKSKESPTWQYIVADGLDKLGFKITDWQPKLITVSKNGKSLSWDYSKEKSMNANKIFKYFSEKKAKNFQ